MKKTLKKVLLPPAERSLPLSALCRKYNISRATASRARRRGWFIRNYHERLTCPAPLSREQIQKIMHWAYMSTVHALRRLIPECESEGFTFSYYEFEDFLQDVIVRFLELSSHPRLWDSTTFRKKTAFHTVHDKIKHLRRQK